MITYEWKLPNGAKILLEKDPKPLAGYEFTYQLRYTHKSDDAILDYNFDTEERFEKHIASVSLVENGINFYNVELMNNIIDEANILVALGRND